MAIYIITHQSETTDKFVTNDIQADSPDAAMQKFAKQHPTVKGATIRERLTLGSEINKQ